MSTNPRDYFPGEFIDLTNPGRSPTKKEIADAWREKDAAREREAEKWALAPKGEKQP